MQGLLLQVRMALYIDTLCHIQLAVMHPMDVHKSDTGYGLLYWFL